VIVVVLAFTAAALSAVSAAGEHRAASRVGRRRPRRRWPAWLGFVAALVTTPLWLASWVLDMGAFFVQATALHLGSLSLVQPLMVSTLVFTLPLAAVECRRWPGVVDWAGTLAVSVGLALVLSTRRAAGADQAEHALYPGLAAVLCGVVVLVVIARRCSAPVRAALFGVAAGGLFGVGAALTKVTASVAATGGLPALVTGWSGYALAAVSLASFGLQQGAYAVGQLATVMTAVVVFDPMTSYFLGVVGFGEPLPAPGRALALGALGMAMVVVGVAVLARSPLLRPATAPRGEPAPTAGGGPGRG
jgi:drug/metabolite transporter (DMT)-like permease